MNKVLPIRKYSKSSLEESSIHGGTSVVYNVLQALYVVSRLQSLHLWNCPPRSSYPEFISNHCSLCLSHLTILDHEVNFEMSLRILHRIL